MPRTVCPNACDNGCECGICLNVLGGAKCFEYRDAWLGRGSNDTYCDHELAPIGIGAACVSLGECGTDGNKDNCISGGSAPTLHAVYYHEDCNCAQPPSPPLYPPPDSPPPPSEPPLPPAPPTPLTPGESLGTLNVTIFERFITISVDLDNEALVERITHYTNTLVAILGSTLAGSATVTVTAGDKVYTNSTDRRSRRQLQTPAQSSYQTGVDCQGGYTPVQANIALELPVPTSQIATLVAALPNSVINTNNDTVFLCGTTETTFNEIERIPAPPPPPAESTDAIVWTVVWALVGAFLLAMCCCGAYGIVVWRRGKKEGDAPWESQYREEKYQSGREQGRLRGAPRALNRAQVVFGDAITKTLGWESDNGETLKRDRGGE